MPPTRSSPRPRRARQRRHLHPDGTRAATTSSPVGTYPIVPLATGANLANYTVVYVDGTLTVGQATLTVTAGERQPRLRCRQPGLHRNRDGRDRERHLHPDGRERGRTTSSPVGPTRSFRWRRARTSRTTPWSTSTDPDGRPGHPDGDGSQRQPRLRCRQPGLHRNRDGRDNGDSFTLTASSTRQPPALRSGPTRSFLWRRARTSRTTPWSTSTAP